MDNNDDSSTSVTDEEEEEEMSRKEIISSEAAPKESQPECDEPIMDEMQSSISDIHQFEKDKKAVYKHPLFPLLGIALYYILILFYMICFNFQIISHINILFVFVNKLSPTIRKV